MLVVCTKDLNSYACRAN